MVAVRHTQSLTDFRQNATETLERLNKSGEAEILTVNGEARAVLLSPAVFDAILDELELAEDVQAMQTSMIQIREGKFVEASVMFADLRARLLEMQKQEQAEKGKGAA